MKESYWESMKNNAIILQNNQKSVNEKGRLLMDQMKYLKELAVRYPNVAAASTEIINLQAILHLPKGTEHYVSDVHANMRNSAIS